MSADNILTDWRHAVEQHLQRVFDDASIDGGRRKIVNRDAAPLIRVFWPGWTIVQRDTVFATPQLVVRYFPTLSKQPSATSPRDEEPLEQAAVDLMAAFLGKNRVGDFVADLACRIISCIPFDEPDAWYVELTLQAYTFNVAERAA